MSKVKMKLDYNQKADLKRYVREKLEETVDTSRVIAARDRLLAETVRLVRERFPAEDMAVLERYDFAKECDHIRLLIGNKHRQEVRFAEPLPQLVPAFSYGHFDIVVPHDHPVVALAKEFDDAKAEAFAPLERQLRQAEVLINVAVYFDDVLDFLDVPYQDRLKLSGLEPEPEEEAPEETAEAEDEPAEDDNPLPLAA